MNMSTTTGEVASLKKEFATLSKTTESIQKANDDDKFQAIMAVSFSFLSFFFLFFFDEASNSSPKPRKRLT